MKLRWSEISVIFQHFCSSLGTTSKHGTMAYHSTWCADISFEIEPLMNTQIHAGDDSLFSSNMHQIIQIVWHEREVVNHPFSSSSQIARICILPHKSGLIRVDIVKRKDVRKVWAAMFSQHCYPINIIFTRMINCCCSYLQKLKSIQREPNSSV